MTNERRLRRWLSNLLTLGGASAAGLLLAEAGLRLVPDLLPETARTRLTWSEVRNDVVSLADPYVGFRYPANTTHEIDRGEIRFTYTTDEHGFRNPSPWPEHAEVVIVGDSQVFGYGVDDDEAWVRLLDESLPDIRVMNLGLIGSSPEQYRRIYESVGIQLNPELLIFGLFPGNDVQGERDFASWEAAGGRGNFDVFRFFGSEAPDTRQRISELFERSYLYQLVRETRRSMGRPQSGRTIELAGGGRVRLAPGITRAAIENARPDHPDFQRVMAAVDGAHDIATENGTEMVVLLLPTKEEIYLPLEGEDAPSPIAAFIPVLEDHGIRYLDLRPAIQEHARRGEQIFFEVDGHPNAAGNRLIAAVVRRDLLARAAASALEGGAWALGSQAGTPAP